MLVVCCAVCARALNPLFGYAFGVVRGGDYLLSHTQKDTQHVTDCLARRVLFVLRRALMFTMGSDAVLVQYYLQIFPKQLHRRGLVKGLKLENPSLQDSEGGQAHTDEPLR